MPISLPVVSCYIQRMEKGNSILTRLSCTCHLSNETIMQFLQMKSQLNCTTVSFYFHAVKIQNSKCSGKYIHWKEATKVCAFDCHLQLISHTPPKARSQKWKLHGWFITQHWAPSESSCCNCLPDRKQIDNLLLKSIII